MRKSFIICIVAAAALLCGCHEPDYVAPTAMRQGITSLTAYFAEGPFAEKEWGRLEVADPDESYFVIPLSYYYPADSEDKAGKYQISVRVKASIGDNCKINPPLGIMDLTEENVFDFTGPDGNTRKITITSKLVKSSVCRILSFKTSDGTVGVVDELGLKIWIPTDNDLSNATATVVISPHTTITPDPSAAANYNSGTEFTITSEDGDTKVTYTVVRGYPATLDYGFNAASMEHIFNLEPRATMGLPDIADPVNVSMAVVDGMLAVNLGNGDAPRYYHQVTGSYVGTLTLGDAYPTGAIASDEGGNMLLCNVAQPGETFTIWKTASPTAAPVEWHSFVNDQDVPIGGTMKIMGNLSAEAVVTVVYDGIPGVTTSSRFRAIHVVGGAIAEDAVVDLAGSGIAWGGGAAGNTCVAAASPTMNDGWYSCAYSDNRLFWFKKDLSVGSSLNGIGPDNDSMYLNGNVDPNNLDSKRFNNASYMVLFASTHFPSWWPGPQLYVYDISTYMLPGANVWDSTALVYSIDNNNMYSFQHEKGATTEYTAAGDVILAPTPDGYKLYLYYYDHYAQMLGGFSVDRLKR
ncbi:MAG: DUF5018 domain-containing protein [Bacteroidales bacterium]|nr:DUF5018 domain-containing protein [Bacteroidales bacterium]